MPSDTSESVSTVVPTPSGESRAVVVAAAVLLIVALAASISVDVVQAGYGVKSDEATYVAMTYSLAYDHDLRYRRGDLERFWGLYKTGPEGIFLKSGKVLRIRPSFSPPFLHLDRVQEPVDDHLYFGKPLVYPIVAAPFVRTLGMNGFLVLHVVLLTIVCCCGYLFLRARSRPIPALAYTLAFVGAAVVPVYAVYLLPDLFYFSLVFVAYFFWLYKEVRSPVGGWLAGGWTNLAAVVLLGVAAYAKPPNVALVAPLILLPWWRKQLPHAIVLAVVFAASVGGLFAANALVTGEFNYQGGDRKTFYGSFPFDSARDVWNGTGVAAATNDSDAASVLAPSEFVNRFSHNVEYFLVGRHFGFAPYFFPGLVALVAWALSRDRFLAWRTLTVLTLVGGTAGWLIIAPYSWSGGGGPVGNRYFLSTYPLLFFLMPPMQSSAAALIAWAGGALFTAKVLINPFVIAKNTWELAEHGVARRLPVELTMPNDLPAMLAQPLRGHIPYRNDPMMLLYFLDGHAYPPEPTGMWVSGAGRADIIVKTDEPVHHFAMTADSTPIRTTLTVSAGAGVMTIPLVPGKKVSFNLAASSVRGFLTYECLLSAQSSDGFIPHLRDPASTDGRNLGVLLNFKAE